MSFLKIAKMLLGYHVGLFVGSGQPTDGTTLAGVAGPSSLYFRTDAGVVYINTNTKASPTWKSVTHA